MGNAFISKFGYLGTGWFYVWMGKVSLATWELDGFTSGWAMLSFVSSATWELATTKGLF